MQIERHIQVPTGDILIVKGQLGLLEMLSIGDYGKDINLKADFMGLDREPDQVLHTELLPLETKWVITISTQYGCSMDCNFCSVPQVGPGKNATFNDLIEQVMTGIRLHPEVHSTKRLNIHYARMGEPTWNPHILSATEWFKDNINLKYKIHPVVSTMMPKKNIWLRTFIHSWMQIKNELLEGNAGLQLSINSTDEDERTEMFHGNGCTLEEISHIMKGVVPVGRKITLNFALADYKIDPEVLLRYFHPDYYVIKITPMHKTPIALQNNIKTSGDYTTYHPFQECEKSLSDAGYDVLVFIASEEEDLGRITCGNAILSGSQPECEFADMRQNRSK